MRKFKLSMVLIHYIVVRIILVQVKSSQANFVRVAVESFKPDG